MSRGRCEDFAKLLATAAPLDTAAYPGSHPAGLWAQEWLPLLKMTKTTTKNHICLSLKNFPL